jgi:hypothetical protein
MKAVSARNFEQTAKVLSLLPADLDQLIFSLPDQLHTRPSRR